MGYSKEKAASAPTPAKGNKGNFKPADAFLNLVIVTVRSVPKLDDEGQPVLVKGKPVMDEVRTEHKLPKGVALDLDNRLGRSLINAAAADENFKINLEGTVQIMNHESEAEDISFI